MDADLTSYNFAPIDEKLSKVDRNTLVQMVEKEDRPPFEFREQFRAVLMQFFNQTNNSSGSYMWAEQKAKEYFEENYNIPQTAWNYRVRKPN
jgi:membrane-bound lytic murein transglycosylase B